MSARRIAVLTIIALLLLPLCVTGSPPLLSDPHAFHNEPLMADGVWLAQLLPLGIADKIFMALALILPFLGTIALHDATFGKRSWWPLASAVVVYNAAFLAGLFNFTVAIGCAMLGAAAWIRWQNKPWRQTAAVALIALPIFFTHGLGIYFLVLMIGGFELHAAMRTRQWTTFATQSAQLALAMLPVAWLFVHDRFSFNGNSADAIAHTIWWTLAKFDPLQTAIGAGASFLTYDMGIDLLILTAVAAAFAALALAQKLSFSWLTVVTIVLMLAYPFASGSIADPGWIDIRLPVLAGFLLFAGIMPRRLGRRETAVLVLAFATLIVARIGVITVAWQGQNAVLAEFQSSAPQLVAQFDDTTATR